MLHWAKCWLESPLWNCIIFLLYREGVQSIIIKSAFSKILKGIEDRVANLFFEFTI